MKEIVNTLKQMSGRYTYHIIFRDWIEAMALSIQNSCYLIHDSIWEEREKRYLNVMQKYTPEERSKFSQMMAMLTQEFEQDFQKGELRDILGKIYMSENSGSKSLGQFFTPFHLSELCARLDLQFDHLGENDQITLNEPSSGAGGMIIATIKVLMEKGIDYQRRLDIVAQDLDWNGVYMTYVQLSLLGAKATVVQGDTLCEQFDPGKTPRNRILYTPMKMGVLI